MNNKKIFSVNLFWQSFKQLKAIGIACTVILFFMSVFPIVERAIIISTEMSRQGLESAFLDQYPTIVNVVGENSYLAITFIIFTPLLALNCWKFLNKRSTSDFYHSLPYKRICLFLSKLAAVFAWLLVMYLISGAGNMASFAIFSKYFIVDYSVIFRMYVSMFICCILCVGAISLACSFTGNILTNVCMTGIILFLPRMLLYIISGAVESSVYVISAEHFVPIFGNSANMITHIVFDVMFGMENSSAVLQKMVFSPVSNIYTLVLGLIYIAVGAVLFITRKSECAGKAAIGRASRFFVRTVLCFSICAVMVLPVFCSKQNDMILYIIFSFVIAGVAIIIYECIQSKNIKGVVACLPAMAVSYAVTIIIGVVVNVGAAGILEYNPKLEDVDYITLEQPSNGYSYDQGINYFKSITSGIKIEDKKIINEVCKAVESNIKLVKEDKINSILYVNSSKQYKAYNVYIKDGVVGHHRKVYLSPDAVEVITQNMQNVESYKEAYLNLPDADSVELQYTDNISKEQKKVIYNTLLEEVKTIKFADWYDNVNRDSYAMSVDITFSRNGYVYNATIPLSEKLPKTSAALLGAVNESAAADNEMLDALLNKLQQAKEGKLVLSESSYESIGIEVRKQSYSEEEYIYRSMEDYVSENPDTAPEIIDKLINSVKNKNYGKNIDMNRAYVKIYYYYEEIDDMVFRPHNISYYIQLDGYDNVSDYGRTDYGTTGHGTDVYDIKGY